MNCPDLTPTVCTEGCVVKLYDGEYHCMRCWAEFVAASDREGGLLDRAFDLGVSQAERTLADTLRDDYTPEETSYEAS